MVPFANDFVAVSLKIFEKRLRAKTIAKIGEIVVSSGHAHDHRTFCSRVMFLGV